MIKDGVTPESIADFRANLKKIFQSKRSRFKHFANEYVISIQDVRFLDDANEDQLKVFANIVETKNKPIFIKRHAAYLLAKKKLMKKTDGLDESNKFFESLLKLGKCFTNSLKEMANIFSDDIESENLQVVLLKQILDRAYEKGEGYIFYNALSMMRSCNPDFSELMNTMWKFDRPFNLNSGSDTASKIIECINKVFQPEISKGATIDKIFNRLMYVIAIAKE